MYQFCECLLRWSVFNGVFVLKKCLLYGLKWCVGNHKFQNYLFGAPTVCVGDPCQMLFRWRQNRSDRWRSLASTATLKGEKAWYISRVSLSHYAREHHKCTRIFVPFPQFHTIVVYGAWKYNTYSTHPRWTVVCGSLHTPISVNLRDRFYGTPWMVCSLDVAGSEDVTAKKQWLSPTPTIYDWSSDS